jgi:hypothetical protein
MENIEIKSEPVKGSKWKKVVFWVLFFLALSTFVYVYICGRSYSSGTRTGIVVKLSHKGFVFKTYEGELNLGGLSEGDGTIMPNHIWNFSVERSNDSIYDVITKTEGRHVRLYYKEVIKNFFWQSETPYLIEKVEVVK